MMSSTLDPTPIVPSLRKVYADGKTIIVARDADGESANGTVQSTYSRHLSFRKKRILDVMDFSDNVPSGRSWHRVSVAVSDPIA